MELNLALSLAALLIGILLGAIFIFSKEAKRDAIRVFGAIVLAAIGGGLYYFQTEQLNTLWQFLSLLVIGFVLPLIGKLIYKRVHKVEEIPLGISFGIPYNPLMPLIISQNPPKISGRLEKKGNLIWGYKFIVYLNINNTTNIILNDLSLNIEIISTSFQSPPKNVSESLSELLPGEIHSYVKTIKMGRKRGEYIVTGNVNGMGVVLGQRQYKVKI